MRYLVLAIASVWLAVGITVSYAPEAVSSFLAVEWLGPWFRFGAFVPLAMGVIMLAGAARFHAAWYVRTVGALSLIKGLFFLVAPTALARQAIEIYLGMPIWAMRALALCSTVLAIALAVIAAISLFEEDVI